MQAQALKTKLEALPMLADKRILLIIGGGIAAYKSLDLIRRLRERGAHVRVIMTRASQEFVTPLAAAALSENRVHTELFDLTSEHEISHIRLVRESDLIVIAPATANLLARMASGLGDELATACLLAAKAPILACPAMNPAMWSHPATRRNVAQLKADGVLFFGPAAGKMAERGEEGAGRLKEPTEIAEAVVAFFSAPRPLTGLKALVTSGPTREPIDPVRYIANRSSGKQGHAIAAALADAGAEVTLISGPVALADPAGVKTIHVETARQMLVAVEQALPADIAVMAAAVADWRPSDEAASKIKKDGSGQAPALSMVENPDILATLGHHPSLRPRLLIGFAAETDDVLENGAVKLRRKGADMIVANDVSPEGGVMGGDANTVHLISAEGITHWPKMAKNDVARHLVDVIARTLK